MSDRGQSTATDSGVRDSKRRRIDDSAAEDATAPAAAEGYAQWHEESQAQATQQPFVSGQQAVPPYAASSAAEYSHKPAAAALNEGSQWQQSDTPAYPNLGTYSQQPYFYQQQNSSTYNPSWLTSESSAYNGLTAPAISLSVGEPSGTATMPFFPPARSANAGELNAGLDGATAFNYPDAEHASQYASFGKSKHARYLLHADSTRRWRRGIASEE